MIIKKGMIRKVTVEINMEEQLVITMDLVSKDKQYHQKKEIPIESESGIAEVQMLMSCANVKKLTNLNGKSMELHFNDEGELLFIARDVIWWRNSNSKKLS